jgi:hypothetical protein
MGWPGADAYGAIDRANRSRSGACASHAAEFVRWKRSICLRGIVEVVASWATMSANGVTVAEPDRFNSLTAAMATSRRADTVSVRYDALVELASGLNGAYALQ